MLGFKSKQSIGSSPTLDESTEMVRVLFKITNQKVTLKNTTFYKKILINNFSKDISLRIHSIPSSPVKSEKNVEKVGRRNSLFRKNSKVKAMKAPISQPKPNMIHNLIGVFQCKLQKLKSQC
ncbi:hypothetical protein HDV02_000425 [Globomyces sp. JEL0801]|nr:hypothetical protein HDV02_000425 [Globomyces sp. JEL0801]